MSTRLFEMRSERAQELQAAEAVLEALKARNDR